MKEQDVPEAGFWEKAGVYTLLWLEKHLEQKVAPIDQERKWPLGRKIKWSLGTMAAGSGAILLVGILGEVQRPWLVTNTSGLIAQASEEKIPQNYNALDWQKQPDIISSIKEAKRNQDLTIIEAKPFPLRVVKNNLFYQTSHGVILAINTKSLEEWLNQYEQTNPTIAFVFNDKTTSQMSISGVKNFWLELDGNWQTNVHGKTPSELNISFSSYLSSMVAVTNEYISQYGMDETIRIFSSPNETPEWQSAQKRFSWYQEQFINNELPTFIKVIAVNPKWITQKLNQSQRP